MLNLRRLAVFHEVAERGSFSGAALALDYTQSVVSHHVAQLERELGLTLVERGKRPVRLTPAGERLHAHAVTILGAARTAEAELRAVAGLEAGTLRIGAFLTACTTFVPAAIGAFAAEHPAIDVRLDQLEPDASLPRLIVGELDLAVAYMDGDSEPPDPRLAGRRLAHDPYRVALHPRHRLARRRVVRLADLSGERFVAPQAAGRGIEYRSMLERLCRDAGFSPDIAYTVTDVTVARGFVAAGLTVAVLPDMTISQPRPDVAVKPLDGVEPARSVHVMWVRDRVTPGLAPMLAALADAAGRQLDSP